MAGISVTELRSQLLSDGFGVIGTLSPSSGHLGLSRIRHQIHAELCDSEQVA